MSIKDLYTTMKEKYAIRSAQWMQRRFASLFNQVADPIVRLHPEDVIHHQIVIYVSYPIDKRPVTIDDYQLEHVLSDEIKTCVYVNHKEKRLIMAHKGTEVTNTKDILSNLQIIFGVSGLDSRVVQALKDYDRIQALYPEYKKQICGHSLGGTICYIIAKHREPDRCTVFNPGSSPNPLFIQMLTDTMQKAVWTSKVYTYKILGDIVSTFSFVGNTKLFRVASVDPYFLHGYANFVQNGVQYVELEGIFTLPKKTEPSHTIS